MSDDPRSVDASEFGTRAAHPEDPDPNDPALTSFIAVSPESHFPIQNLPFGVFSTPSKPSKRVGVAIGDRILDLAVLERAGRLPVAADARIFDRDDIHAFLECGPAVWKRTRRRIGALLRGDRAELRDDSELRARAFVAMDDARMHLPVRPSGFTDFYSSKEHATNVGMLFRDPQKALLPNWLELPVAYNGRASSVVVSGTPVRRPSGQFAISGAARPGFAPTRKLDFELETAFIVGEGNALGEPVDVADAERRIFGLVLLNDWTARDIQQWEYVPLGPFNGKSFATSISPWVVMLEALEPFRAAGPQQVPEPLPYLRHPGANGYDIALEVALRPGASGAASTICRGNAKTLYWSMAQQLAHHTVSGCNARPGDLMGSGTISGEAIDSVGSLIECTSDGRYPLQLGDGTTRTYLEDGDEVVMTGYCTGATYRVGFGELRGRVVPAAAAPGDASPPPRARP